MAANSYQEGFLTEAQLQGLKQNKQLMADKITDPKLRRILVCLDSVDAIATADLDDINYIQGSPSRKMARLVDVLLKGTSEHYKKFLAILRDRDTGMEAVADVIEQTEKGWRGHQGSRSTGAAVTPASSLSAPQPEVQIESRQVKWEKIETTFNLPPGVEKVKIKKYDQDCVITEKDDDIYPDMKQGKKGKVAMICISKFKKLKQLEGYRIDRDRLTQAFHQIGYEVYIARTVQEQDENITADEMDAAVKMFADEKLDGDPSFVLVILTHGGEDGILYGTNGYTDKRGNKPVHHDIVNIDRLMSYVDNKNCPDMRGKPKVVILQACQGEEEDDGEVVAASSKESPAQYEIDREGESSGEMRIPTITDCVTLLPSSKGQVSYVSKSKGSFMIQHLISVLEEHACDKDIHNIFTKVNRKSAEKRDKYIQMSNFRSSLTKQLYFYPGTH